MVINLKLAKALDLIVSLVLLSSAAWPRSISRCIELRDVRSSYDRCA
jgi:hypothetical protein